MGRQPGNADCIRREALCIARHLHDEIGAAVAVLERSDAHHVTVDDAAALVERLYCARVRLEPATVRLGKLMVAVEVVARDGAGGELVARFAVALETVSLYDEPALDEETIRVAVVAWAERRGGRVQQPSKWRAFADLARRAGMSPPSAQALKVFWNRTVRKHLLGRLVDGAR